MFGLFKKKNKTPVNEIVRFLNDANEALMLAYMQGDISAVTKYFTYPYLDVISEDLRSGVDLTQELGLAKYRVITWSDPVAVNDKEYTSHKSLRHKDVKIRGLIDIPVGDNVDEMWYVISTAKGYFVTDIRRLDSNVTY